jgi:hypothetical protein
VALVVGGCGGSSKTSTSTTNTPDEQGASGPLVGDPTLIAGEQSCEQGHPNAPEAERPPCPRGPQRWRSHTYHPHAIIYAD